MELSVVCQSHNITKLLRRAEGRNLAVAMTYMSRLADIQLRRLMTLTLKLLLLIWLTQDYRLYSRWWEEALATSTLSKLSTLQPPGRGARTLLLQQYFQSVLLRNALGDTLQTLLHFHVTSYSTKFTRFSLIIHMAVLNFLKSQRLLNSNALIVTL